MNSRAEHAILQGIQEVMEDAGIEFVRFEYGDLCGISRSKVVPSRHVQEKMSRGVNIPLCYLAVEPAGDLAPGTGYGATWCSYRT